MRRYRWSAPARAAPTLVWRGERVIQSGGGGDEGEGGLEEDDCRATPPNAGGSLSPGPGAVVAVTPLPPDRGSGVRTAVEGSRRGLDSAARGSAPLAVWGPRELARWRHSGPFDDGEPAYVLGKICEYLWKSGI